VKCNDSKVGTNHPCVTTGRPSGSDEFHWIRGIRVHPSAKSRAISGSFRSREKPDISRLINSSLARSQQTASSCTAVQCILTLDGENYIVKFHSSEPDEDTILETLVFERTQELVDFLRLPFSVGGPIGVDGENSHQYTWNPYTDIQYGDLDILRPYIERKKPFVSTRITPPETASELIQSETATVNLEIKHDTHQCPIWLGIGNDHASCWVLERRDYDVPNAVSSILGNGLTDAEISEIMKSKEIHLSGTRYEINIRFPDEEDYEERLVFRESRLFAWHLGVRPIQPSSFLRTDEEQLYCDLFKEENSILMRLVSDLTEDVVYSGPLVHLFKGMEIQQAIDHVDQVLVEIISNRFAEGTLEERIKSLDKLYSKVSELIKEHTSNGQ
jgi:hypothetical protein